MGNKFCHPCFHQCRILFLNTLIDVKMTKEDTFCRKKFWIIFFIFLFGFFIECFFVSFLLKLVIFFVVILRKPAHPHTRNIKKSDPVARYQQFQQSWQVQKAPGEKNHKNLRWNVREQMLAQDIVYEKVCKIYYTCKDMHFYL